MKKKESTYLGGEADSPEKVAPRIFEHFLSKKAMFGVLAMISAFAVLVMLWM
ncbi:MAG: hypothetical protein QW703_00110 [Candidatus Aenigmatarchaeota archaeon]